jgi:hypothetical protein
MTTLKVARLFVGARQLDVAAATNVPLSKIGAAERGVNSVSESEQALIWRYLRGRAVQMRAPASILKEIFGLYRREDNGE